MTNSRSVTAVGPYRFDRDANELTDDEGRSTALRPQTGTVLAVLLDNAGSVVTKDITDSGTYAGNPARKM